MAVLNIKTPGLRVRWLGENHPICLLHGKVYDVEEMHIWYDAEKKEADPCFHIRDEDDMASHDTASVYGPDEDFEIAEGADVYAAAEREAEKRLGFKVPFPEIKKAREAP